MDEIQNWCTFVRKNDVVRMYLREDVYLETGLYCPRSIYACAEALRRLEHPPGQGRPAEVARRRLIRRGSTDMHTRTN